MLTSFASKGQQTSIPRSRGLDLDTEDYLDKPISPEELLKVVERYT
jgi:DNA-binding response OmpR family regulator